MSAVALSPDGARLAFTFHGKLWVASTAGGGLSVVMPTKFDGMVTWSPDSQSVAFGGGGDGAMWVVRIGSDQTPFRLPRTVICQSAPVWSPDGQWIACGNPPDTILLVSPDGQRQRILPSPAPPARQGYFQMWSRDAQTLYVGSSAQRKPKLYAVDVKTGRSRLIAEYDAGAAFNTAYFRSISGSLMPGGKGIATTVLYRRSDIWMLEGFPQPRRGWF